MIYRDWAEYVADVLRVLELKVEDAAAMAGIHPDGIRRWVKGQNQPRAEQVVSFAEGLKQDSVEALIAAGYLPPDAPKRVVEVHQSVRDLSDDKLVAELTRRLSDRPKIPKGDDVTPRLLPPADDLGESGQNGA